MGALVETQNITNTKYINDMRRVCLVDSSMQGIPERELFLNFRYTNICRTFGEEDYRKLMNSVLQRHLAFTAMCVHFTLIHTIFFTDLSNISKEHTIIF